MEQNSEIIYLETDEDITFIIERLRKNKARKITLVIPKKARLFQSAINLKILKEQAEKLKKDVVVVTTDSAGKNMAGKAGLAAHRQIIPADNLSKKETKKKGAAEVDSGAGGGQKNQIKKPLVNIVGGMKIDRKSSVVHLENKKLQNQKKEVSEDDHKGEMKRVEMLGAAAKKNNFNKDNFNKSDNSKTSSRSFNESEKEFDLFRGSLSEDRTISLLPTLSARFFAVFISACLAVFAIVASFVLPEAKVDIFMKTERVANNFKFAIDKNIIEPDIQLNKLPANAIEVVSKESREFSATGKKQLNEKAKGKITIYNEYSTGSQSLIANTRFLSKEGKIFRIRKNITIPGFTKPEDEIIPGTVEVEVFAEEAGEGYNIGPTSFTIPAFQEMGSPKYAGIYARSTAAMSGGSTKEVLVISESDISKAKNALLESLKKKNTAGIENEIGENDGIINDTREDKVVEIKLSNKAGEQVEKGTITIELSSKVLTIRRDDINVLVDGNFGDEFSSNKMKLIPESKKIEYGDPYLDDDKNIIFPVYVEQEAVKIIDLDQIKKDIVGKDEPELRRFFSEMEGIKTVNISFWPFWVKNVPHSVKKIKIEIK